MFFVLSKTIGYLLLPTNLLIGIGLVGAILMFTRFASLGRKLVIAAVLLLVICGLSPLGKILLYPLEQRFPSWDASRGAPDGIIVLGASIEPDLSVAHNTPVVRGAPDRIIAAAAMIRSGAPCTTGVLCATERSGSIEAPSTMMPSGAPREASHGGKRCSSG